jgi:tetratricopeptide (TPR) repeat protein/cold shock CspA family protein
MFALISALEIDLREFLALHVIPAVKEENLLPPAIYTKSIERFNKEIPDETPTIRVLLDFLDLGDEIQLIRKHENNLDATTKIYIKKYYFGFEALIPIRNRVMHSRPLEYDDLMRVSDLGYALVNSHKSLWANLRTNLGALRRDPEYAATLTIPDSIDDTTKILHNLPPPEFDDTGFVGREKELAEVKKALVGPYPIVTIVGEGGLGKTALALKACYDLLDDDRTTFDAIVWTTAKATKLTINEIELIKGAVVSSIGIIDSAIEPLGRQKGTEAIDDLMLHLTNNKILLIIDNLETVIDNNIRYLVSNIPASSRILFTTRIGLGAYDFPISLLPLNKKDATFYFRRAAQVLGVNDFATTPSQLIGEYCDKLHNNTLFIKWFMQSVRVGKRPTILITEPKIFLQFCLQNVFNNLSSHSKMVARTLAVLGIHQSVAGLAFFSELDSLSIQGALSVLITANIVSAERGRSTEDEDRYMLSALARMYITKYLRPDVEEQRRLIKKQNELRFAKEDLSSRIGTDIFDLNHVFIRDNDDYIVAKILMRAIELVFKSELDLAEMEFEKAADLAPNYFEVHRVKAMCHYGQGDVVAAAIDYEAAISLAPDRAPLRMWYGGFLSRSLGDRNAALTQLLEAERLAPSAVIVKLECARVLQYLRRFDEAATKLQAIPDIEKQPSRARRVHLDLLLQNELKRAETLIKLEDFEGSLTCLEAAMNIFKAAPNALIDRRTVINLNHVRRHFPALRRAFRNLPNEKRLEVFERWLPFSGAPTLPEKVPNSEESSVTVGGASADSEERSEPLPSRGRLIQIHEKYAFVDVGGTHFFFHAGWWVGSADFSTLSEGTIVQFDADENDRGLIALNVRTIVEIDDEIRSEKRLLGAIKDIRAKHGFVKLDMGGEVFFQRDDCADGTRFRTLTNGVRVRCRVVTDEAGKKRASNVEVYSGSVAD